MIRFQIGKTRVELRFSFFAVLLLMAEISRSDRGLLCVLACLLHETGHLCGFVLSGQMPRAVILESSGMRIRPRNHPLPGFWEVLILLAGPTVNLACGWIFWELGLPISAWIHLFLAVFNLLPLAPLDGGQLFRIAATRFCGLRTGYVLSRTVHWCTFQLLTAAGLFLFLKTGNFTLLLTVFCLSMN